MQIEASLEKENIDSEVEAVGASVEEGTAGEAGEGESLHSSLLLGDIEEVRQKIDKFHGKGKEEEDPATLAGQALASCYRCVMRTLCQTFMFVSQRLIAEITRRRHSTAGERCRLLDLRLRRWRRCVVFIRFDPCF